MSLARGENCNEVLQCAMANWNFQTGTFMHGSYYAFGHIHILADPFKKVLVGIMEDPSCFGQFCS